MSRDEMDGEYLSEKYITQEYAFDYIPDDEAEWVEFMTDDEYYCYVNGDRITVKSFLGQEVLEDLAEFGVTSGKFEYVLDAQARKMVVPFYLTRYRKTCEFMIR